MKTNTNTLLIVLALVLGLSGFVVANIYLKSVEEVHPVVVARRNIGPMEEIRPTDLAIREVHVSAILPNAFTRLEDVYADGELVMAKSAIYANQQLLKDAVERKSVANSLSYLLTLYGKSPENRAYSISVNNSSSFGGRIKPLDLVDVIAVFDAQGILKDSFSKRILSNVTVLDVVGADVDATRKNVEVVTLLLNNPREAELLAMVETFSRSIRLALVPKVGTSTMVTSGYTTETLMQALGLDWIAVPILPTIPGGVNFE